MERNRYGLTESEERIRGLLDRSVWERAKGAAVIVLEGKDGGRFALRWEHLVFVDKILLKLCVPLNGPVFSATVVHRWELLSAPIWIENACRSWAGKRGKG